MHLVHQFKFSESVLNACTLVPTIFLRHRKTEFKLLVLFFVYPRHWKREFKLLLNFLFLFSATTYWKRNWNCYFRFSFSHYFNTTFHFCFSSSVFVGHWKMEFELRFSFFRFLVLFSVFMWRHHIPKLKNTFPSEVSVPSDKKTL